MRLSVPASVKSHLQRSNTVRGACALALSDPPLSPPPILLILKPEGHPRLGNTCSLWNQHPVALSDRPTPHCVSSGNLVDYSSKSIRCCPSTLRKGS